MCSSICLSSQEHIVCYCRTFPALQGLLNRGYYDVFYVSEPDNVRICI